MSKILNNKYLLLFSQAIIAVIFIFAGVEKIADPDTFARSINNYNLFPDAVINLFAVFIPWIEVVSGILLLFGRFIKENAVIIETLLVIFTVLVIISVFRGLNIECGCFGTMSGSRVGWQKVAENTGLILLCLYIILYSEEK